MSGAAAKGIGVASKGEQCERSDPGDGVLHGICEPAGEKIP